MKPQTTNWWEVKYYTEHPYTSKCMIIADNEDEAKNKFNEKNENKAICGITKLK